MTTAFKQYSFRPIAVAHTLEQLEQFYVQERALPNLSRVVLEVNVSPEVNIIDLAGQVQEEFNNHLIPYWPEYPNQHVFISGSTLQIAYLTSSITGQVSPSGLLAGIGVIIGIFLLLPIILYFAIPGFADLINGLIAIAIMMIMFRFMTPFLSEDKIATKLTPRELPARTQPPVEQRIASRIESIVDSIEKIDAAFGRSKAAGASAVSSVASDISQLATAVKRSPEVSHSTKAQTARRIDAIDERLLEYEKHLNPRQKANLEEQRRIVEELRAMYD